MKEITLIVFSLFGLPAVAGVGECCAGHYDILGKWHDPMWCDAYCCGTITITLYCCENPLLRCDSRDSSGYCIEWWIKNAEPYHEMIGSAVSFALGWCVLVVLGTCFRALGLFQ